jgi:DNA-binding HxlR family transcriptional regulator
MIIIKEDYINILSLIQVIEMKWKSEILFDLKTQAEKELRKLIKESDPSWLYEMILLLRRNAKEDGFFEAKNNQI